MNSFLPALVAILHLMFFKSSAEISSRFTNVDKIKITRLQCEHCRNWTTSAPPFWIAWYVHWGRTGEFEALLVGALMLKGVTGRFRLVHSKNKRDQRNTTHAVYEASCSLIYISETGGKFGTWLGKHKSEVEKDSNQAGRKESWYQRD